MPFFPDYHLTQAMRDVPIEVADLLTHLSFNFLYFLVAFVMALALALYWLWLCSTGSGCRAGTGCRAGSGSCSGIG